MAKEKAQIIARGSLLQREPQLLNWNENVELTPKSHPDVFAGTHRLAIGRVVGKDFSRPYLQGYLVCERGTFYFLPSGDASNPVYRVPPNHYYPLPVTGQAIHILAHSKEDLRGGTSYEVSRVRLKLDKNASADTEFVCVVQPISEGTAPAKAPVLTKRRLLIGGLVAAALAAGGSMLLDCGSAEGAELKASEFRLEE